jgi:hypothetical protein
MKETVKGQNQSQCHVAMDTLVQPQNCYYHTVGLSWAPLMAVVWALVPMLMLKWVEHNLETVSPRDSHLEHRTMPFQPEPYSIQIPGMSIRGIRLTASSPKVALT